MPPSGCCHRAGSQPSALGDRHCTVILAVDDCGWRRDTAEVIGDVDVVTRCQQPTRRCRGCRLPLVMRNTTRRRRPCVGANLSPSTTSTPESPVLIDQAEHVLTHAGCGHDVAVNPPAVEDEARHGLRVTRGPPHRERRTEGGADQVSGPRPPSRPAAGPPARSPTSARSVVPDSPPRSVVSHETCDRLPTPRRTRARPAAPRARDGTPPRHIDRDRARTGNGRRLPSVFEVGPAKPRSTSHIVWSTPSAEAHLVSHRRLAPTGCWRWLVRRGMPRDVDLTMRIAWLLARSDAALIHPSQCGLAGDSGHLGSAGIPALPYGVESRSNRLLSPSPNRGSDGLPDKAPCFRTVA